MAAGTSRTTWCPARPGQSAGDVTLAFQADISVPPLPLLNTQFRHQCWWLFLDYVLPAFDRGSRA